MLFPAQRRLTVADEPNSLQPPVPASGWCRAVPIALFLAAAAAAFASSLFCHPRLVPGGEYDQYLQLAEGLLRGEVVDDRFHPMLVPELVAAAGFLTGDPFVGGKVVAALAWSGLLLALFALLRSRWSPGQALAGALALGLHPFVALQALQVAADLPGAAFAVGAWAIALRGADRPRTYALAGILAGAAFAARFNLGLHMVALVAVALATAGAGRWRAAGAALLGASLGFLPHALPRALCFGSPFGNDNWKNLVLKYHLDYDMHALGQLSDSAAAALLREHAGSSLWRGLQDFLAWLVDGLPAQVLGAPSVGPLAAGAVLAIVAGGAVGACRPGARVPRILFAVALLHAAAVVGTFRPEPRLLLPALVLGGAAVLLALPAWLSAAATGLLLLTASLLLGPAFGAFRASHHEAEVAAARALVAERGELTQLAGTYPFLDREVRCAAVGMIQPFGTRTDVSEAEFWRRLDETAAARPASLFVFGPTGGALHRLARDAALPPGWRRTSRDGNVVVLERLPPSGLALSGPTGPWREGPLRLSLAAGAPAAVDTAWRGVVLRGPGGEDLRLSFVVPAAGAPFVELPRGALARGEWHALPTVLQRDGALLQGAPLRLVVE